MAIGIRLREARESAGLSQQDVAQALGIDRVTLSYWENEKRTPGLKQLQRLAEFYGATTAALLGQPEVTPPEISSTTLLRHLEADEVQARSTISRWLTFLDQWADLKEETGEPLPGRSSSLLPEGRDTRPITDTRRAPTLAGQLRERLKLGDDAIPDLLLLLDRMGILVYRDDLGKDSRISGVFYNHPRLGAAILINSCHLLGRQLFTLAHELAHAQFHYQEHGLISRTTATDPKERFANTFAAHFLVPRAALIAAVDRRPINDPYDVVWLQSDFRVSYAMLLNRLHAEGLIPSETYEQYKTYSAVKLARRLQIDTASLQGRPGPLPELESYPPAVVDQVIAYLRKNVLSVAAATSLLDVPQEVIAALLTHYEQAERDDALEFEQLPVSVNARRGKVS